MYDKQSSKPFLMKQPGDRSWFAVSHWTLTKFCVTCGSIPPLFQQLPFWGPKMTAIIRHAACALGLASLLCLSGGADASAQPTQSAPAIADTFVAAIPLRPVDEITKDNERANALRALTKQRLARAQEEVHTLGSMINARKKDLAALEGYVDTLDSDTKGREIALLQQKTAMLEKILDLLELRKKVREGDVASATATIAFTEAQEEMYSLEGTLEKKRSDRAVLAKRPGSSADCAAMDLVIKEMEKQVMELWDKALNKHEDCVSEEQEYLELIRKHANAQEAFRAP